MESMGLMEKVGHWPSATKDYIQGLQMEMRHVTWPSWKQVRATTIVVIAAVFIFAIYFFLVDNVIARLITKVFDAFAK